MEIGIVISAVAAVASAAALLVSVFRKPAPVIVPSLHGSDLQKRLDAALMEIDTLRAQLSEAVASSRLSDRKMGAEVLAAYADQAVASAKQFGGSNDDKLKMALDALRVLDAGDNGQRDWSDAQHRIAIEAAIARSK